MSTYWKFYYRVSPSHTHARVFSANGPDRTYANNGDIIFRNEEWKDFQAQFGFHQTEYINEGENQTAPEKAYPASGLGPHQKMRQWRDDR